VEGVLIYKKESCSSSLQSTKHELLTFDPENMKMKIIATTHDGVSYSCFVEISSLFRIELMAYNPIVAIIFYIVENNGFIPGLISM